LPFLGPLTKKLRARSPADQP